MEKNPHLYRHSKRLPSVKELNNMSKFEKQNMSVSATEVDVYNYKCPCCGKNMELVKANYESRNDIHYLICKECDMKAKLRRERNGKLLLVSTPADCNTRALRKETHYYFDIINKYRIFTTKSQTYQWLSEQIFIFGMGIKHIGEFGAYDCEKAIDVCITCLENNISKMPNGFYYYHTPEGNSYTERNHRE